MIILDHHISQYPPPCLQHPSKPIFPQYIVLFVCSNTTQDGAFATCFKRLQDDPKSGAYLGHGWLSYAQNPRQSECATSRWRAASPWCMAEGALRNFTPLLRGNSENQQLLLCKQIRPLQMRMVFFLNHERETLKQFSKSSLLLLYSTYATSLT